MAFVPVEIHLAFILLKACELIGAEGSHRTGALSETPDAVHPKRSDLVRAGDENCQCRHRRCYCLDN